MEIIEYFSCSENQKFLRQIEAQEWSAAKYLATHLEENRLIPELGGWANLFLLTDGENLVSFLTLSAQDCIAEPTLTPWLGFFHTTPAYRGHRYGKILIDHACRVAKEMGYHKIYLATDHINLYEKYGFSYLENRVNIYGTDSRVYERKL